MIIDLPKISTNTAANVPMRGIEPPATAVRDEVSIVEGRMFKFGTNEVIVGRGASGQFAGLTVGSTIVSGQNTWQVVGMFEADGGVAETEIWCDARVLQGAYRRGNTLPVGAGAPRFERQLRHLPRLADGEPAGQRAGAARDGVLRAAVARAHLADPARSASASRR